MGENRNYRFGDYLLIPSEHLIKHHGKSIYLRPKTFETLLLLIKNKDQVVPKEQLLDEIWKDTCVTEGTLTHSIKELRALFNDDPLSPRYIKTFPKLGYKFIAPVEIVENRPQKIQTLRPFKIRSILARWGNLGIWSRSLSFFAVIIIGTYLLAEILSSRMIDFSKRDWVLIGAFDGNGVNQSVVSALQTAIELEISQSPYVNVVSRDRVSDVLKLMKKDPSTRLDPEIAREVSLRDGHIRLLINGTINAIGNRYQIALKIIDPVDGQLISGIREQAGSEKEILPTIKRLSRLLRLNLGESLSSLNQYAYPLAPVTTSSLEALSYYSKALQEANRIHWPMALNYLEQALRHDSTFAMAYLVKAYAYLWIGEPLRAQKEFEHALHFSDRLSDRERYFLLGSYAQNVSGDFNKAIEFYQMLLSIYPDHYWAHKNISICYTWLNRLDDWERHIRECLRIRPLNPATYSDLGIMELFVKGRVDTAANYFSKVLKLDPNFPIEIPYLKDLFRFWEYGQYEAADQIFENLQAKQFPGFFPESRITINWFLARYLIIRGKYNQAISLLQKAEEDAIRLKKYDLSAWSRLDLAFIYQAQKKTKAFREQLRWIEKYGQGMVRISALAWYAHDLLKSGQMLQLGNLIQKLNRENRQPIPDFKHIRIQGQLELAKKVFYFLLQGQSALTNKDTSTAITYFRKVLQLAPRFSFPALTTLTARPYLKTLEELAELYEQQKNYKKAKIAWQSIVNKKFLTITTPGAAIIWTNAYSHLQNIHKFYSH